MPPSESAYHWIVTLLTTPSATYRLSAQSMSDWRWPTQQGKRRAERSPSRLQKTVSETNRSYLSATMYAFKLFIVYRLKLWYQKLLNV